MSALLRVHKLLITMALVLAGLFVVWGVVHGMRGERNAWMVCGMGVVLLPALALYLRKLRRNPPIK
jgi:hypothetical protein